jgi:hypothetical protein
MDLNPARIIIALLITMIFSGSSAQDILCNIQVNSQQIQGTDKRIYENMQSALIEFINDREWTNYDFKPEERIECNMVITIQERPSTDRFSARLNVVASRPIYGSTYNSTLLNYVDNDFDFEYTEFQPMDYQDNQYMSNLTSVIAYYIYIILGLDFDSFSQYGGAPFFEKAELVVNSAQESGQVGWNSFEDQRNRYWLVENYLNQSYRDLRVFFYEYHRNGLDVMSDKAEQGRAAILVSLNYLQKAYDARPGLFALQLVLDAKRDEFVNIFKGGNPKEKEDSQKILKKLDPANSSTYSKISER